MDKRTFEKILQSPSTITSEEAVLLEELAQEFPYCQMAHLLLANDSYQKKSMHYPKKLKKASTYILDRTVLHSLIHSKPTNTSPEIETPKVEHFQENAESRENLKSLVTQQNIDILKEIEENIKEYKKNKEAANLEITQIQENSRKIVFLKTTVNDQDSSKLELGFGEEITKKDTVLLLDYLSESRKDHTPPIDQTSIIDKFLINQPKIQQRTGNIYQEPENTDLSVPSTELKLELITENYALILTKQNKLEKAKEVYKKLMLKYPDKSAYFALKLNELESI